MAMGMGDAMGVHIFVIVFVIVAVVIVHLPTSLYIFLRVAQQIQTRLKAADFGAFRPIVSRKAQSIPSPQ
jgi:hypothetical protein